MTDPHSRKGPLRGVRVLEFAGLGPAPFAAMLLSDMGADVVRVERPGERQRAHDLVLRGRTVVTLDLKRPEDAATAGELAASADILIEGFRPGVMERLGLGPEPLLARNPRLVYGRMTGWGQDGELAHAAGHDINFIALAGALDAVGEADGAPTPPLNLVGDYGGGAMYLVAGVLAALLEARRSGEGQVVDCAICDGVVSLLTQFHGLAHRGEWRPRGAGLYDGGAHFYATYRCADGEYLAVGAAEPKFYAAFREGAGLDDPLFDDQRNPALWPLLKQKTQAVIARRTRAEWLAIFATRDACVTPVLTVAEALRDPSLRERGSVVEVDGVPQSAPAPRFEKTPGAIHASARVPADNAVARWARRD